MVLDIRKSMNALRGLKALHPKALARLPESVRQNERLQEIKSFGFNPGNLRMYKYMPVPSSAGLPLVVVLHGCGQSAADYDHGAGWSTLADRYGFALVIPEQQRANNPNGCFNWFQPDDARRERGEAASIAQMVENMIREEGVNPRRVFVTGLSAGGAMTSVMLACYPEMFAAGAIIAGLPYGAASNVQQAFESMFQCPTRPAREWGDLVRAAAPHPKGSWPRISVWHGSADTTVVPLNAREIVKQWADVHGLPVKPTAADMVDGYPREVWFNEAGDEVLESYSILRMAHGTPLATGDAASGCGAAGPFLLNVGISSSFHIATFFGLTGARAQTHSQTQRMPVTTDVPKMLVQSEATLPGEIGVKEGIWKGSQKPNAFPIDVGAVITRALEAAGLMKR